MASVVLLQMYGQIFGQYLPNFEVLFGKPADDSMRVKSSEAIWFASLHLTSVEANAR